jgi:hypothetical protein
LSTIYDLITVALFAGLVILFLQRSTEAESAQDKIIHYLPPAVGCAVANWLGNNHQDAWAIAALIGVVVYSYLVLKPFKKTP